MRKYVGYIIDNPLKGIVHPPALGTQMLVVTTIFAHVNTPRMRATNFHCILCNVYNRVSRSKKLYGSLCDNTNQALCKNENRRIKQKKKTGKIVYLHMSYIGDTLDCKLEALTTDSL